MAAARGSVLAIVSAILALAACDPFGLPATRALEDGAAGMISQGNSFEMTGQYSAGANRWDIRLQVGADRARHLSVSTNGKTLEAISVGSDTYYRGEQFLAAQLSGNPLGTSLARAAGNAWWKGAPGQAPSLPDFTDGPTFRSTFLGSAATERTDDPPGFPRAVQLSGSRADVYIGTAPPYRLLRVALKKGVVVDGISDAVLDYGRAGTDFHIVTPTDLIDFSNLSTLPPIYTVLSVDTSRCGSPCVVSATVKNLGGTARAQKPSQVEFRMGSAVASSVRLGGCVASIQPDVGYNSTTTVSCTIDAPAQNAAWITATPENSSRA